MADGKRDYYEVLGVGRDATQDDIRRAFEHLADAFKAAGKPRNIDDVEKIRAIATAYRILSDGEKRSRYDQLGEAFTEDADDSLARAEKRVDELFRWLEERRKHDAADFIW